ncbi:hypothetical protein GpartN1_g2883.t1 [Galdieria partita]|uniref:mRNA 5'-phosphatase n=1 Tax=Galdieria partita TaxID=83374 RepID=A0A9C7PTJ6_9RHOD|nr:hypothetical protein GpartN1_g1982.t1 [Galdieria partita]GJQ11092.1 hypothetical protein GpartN1_g2883.t1 [Galdieria partita]
MYNPFEKEAYASQNTLKRKRLQSNKGEEDRPIERAEASTSATFHFQNLFRVRVPDDSVLCLVEFLGRCVTNPHTEVEFKLGLVLEKAENRRVYLPIAAETPLSPEFNNKVRFQSKVDLPTFKLLNNALNNRVENSAKLDLDEQRIVYRRIQEVDRRYRENIRQTSKFIKEADGSMKEEQVRCISKRRIDDLNFLSPRTAYDFRCSCSIEEPCSPPVNVKPISQRKKNRLSYRCKLVQVDITTVFSYEDGQIDLSDTVNDPSSLSYEVELEVTPEACLYDACEKMRLGQPHHVLDIAQCLLDNIRYLTRLLSTRANLLTERPKEGWYSS